MVHYRGPLAFHQITRLLIDAIQRDLETTNGGGGQVPRLGVVPGGIAWDECECGLLAGSFGRMYLTDSFPTPATNSPCPGGFYAAPLTIDLARCVTTAGEGAGFDYTPSEAALEADAAVASADAWQLITTVDCELGALLDSDQIVDYLVTGVTINGPSGGCLGASLTATVGIHRGQNAVA